MKKLLGGIGGFVLLVAIASVSFGQTPVAANIDPSVPALASIKFPITELGGCKNQAACRVYCDNTTHINECVAYGRSHGLMTEAQAAQATEYADVLKGEGPGGCKDEKSCRAYCQDLAHTDECLNFAERHNLLSPADLAQAKQVSKALQNGVQMPGGCKDKAACETYCKDSVHLDECLNFAEKAGMMNASQITEARKVLPFLKSGETPGGCKDKAACESYCQDTAHFEECVSFAEKAGLINADDAAMAKKAGGSGPGGCRSKAACEAYCNASDHAAECFAFAKEKGILPPDKIKEIEDGMGRLRAGMSQMPPEVLSCLTDKLGADTMARLQDGTLTPSQQLGDTVKGCFASFMPKVKAKMEAAMSIATPEVKQCLTDKVGQDNLDKIMNGEAPAPSAGDNIKGCFAILKQEGMKKYRDAMAQVPAEVKNCVTNKLGTNIDEQIQNSEDASIGAKIEGAFQDCSKEFQAKFQGKLQEGLQGVPPAAKDCIESQLGGDLTAKIQSGAIKGEADMQSIINKCMSKANIPSGMPGTNGQIPSGGAGGMGGSQMGPPAGAPPMPASIPPEMQSQICANFASVPDCTFVPAQFQDVCKKCKQ